MRFERVLFAGIGGGNDVFSTLLAGEALRTIGWILPGYWEPLPGKPRP